MKKYCLYIIILVSSLLASQKLQAQDDIFSASFQISFKEGGQETQKPVLYCGFKSETKANKYIPLLDDALGYLRPDPGKNYDGEKWNKTVKELNIPFKRSKNNGAFTMRVFPGMAVLITSFDPTNDITADGAKFKTVIIEEGKTEYNIVVGGEKLKEGQKGPGIGTQNLEEVVKNAKNKDTINIKAFPAIDDGKIMYCRIHVELPAGIGNENSRMVIQPMSVECQMEDTIEYIKGLVVEGYKYHSLQNKQMAFNYFKNDKVAPAYVDIPMWEGDKIYIDTTLVYVKPDKKKLYKIPYEVKIADFNHKFFDYTATTGSCNAKNFFKFLNLGLAGAQMDLDEFYVVADENYESRNQDLRLKFVVGKSILTEDSLNNKQLNDLMEDLRSYGDMLRSVKVAATSSPEGGYESNMRLAKERTQMALRLVQNGLKGADVTFRAETPRVCSWEDVASKLDDQRLSEIASKVRANMGAGGYGGDAAIMNLPEYATYISPVLDELRTMRVTYSYERKHIMEPHEAVAAYNKRKADLIKGKGEDFSDGDYYNLFNTITDPAELDTVTMIAYNHVLKQKGYEKIKFSMYVANRMSMLLQRQGKPNIEVLRKFINPKYRTIAKRKISDDAQYNRCEILINQIYSYFQCEERDTAMSYVEYWFSKDMGDAALDAKVDRLKKYILFKDKFIRYATNQLSGSELSEYEDAFNFVLDCDSDNRAVIFTEAAELLNTPHEVSLRYVRNMSDSNPKKWYLMGILFARLETKELGKKHPAGYVPDYLVYFNHSFELEPKYKKLYFNDGQVDDELRKKYMWRKKDIEAYRNRFNELVTILQPDINEYSENENELLLGGSDDDDDITNKENEEATPNTDNSAN